MNSAELEAELRSRLRLRALAEFADLSLWLAHPGSGLTVLCQRFDAGAPYWGFPWPGGLALAKHVQAHPEIVKGRHVLDYGAGCGLVGIVAHRCGAEGVSFCDTDRLARAAARLNARQNGLVPVDRSPGAPDVGDVVLAGDVFYNPGAAAESVQRLSELREQGSDVLIGDPFRPDLPLSDLVEIARTAVREVGASDSAPAIMAGIFTLA